MALERTYTVPLRKEWLKAPNYRRAKKAMTALKHFLVRHMKSEDVRIGESLNHKIWEKGIKSPPGKVKLTAVKDDEGVVRAELYGVKVEVPKAEEPKVPEAKPAPAKAPAKKAEEKAEKPAEKAVKKTVKKAEKPTDKKPAEKAPAEKPASKPTVKPATTPAEKPKTEPVEKKETPAVKKE